MFGAPQRGEALPKNAWPHTNWVGVPSSCEESRAIWELGTAIPGSQLLKQPDQKWSLGAERMKEGWKAKELWRARGRRAAGEKVWD